MLITLDFLSKLTPADRVQVGLLLAAVVGIALTYWQVRSNAQTQRALFLKDLYSTLTTDPSICKAYYLIEYGTFTYGPEFHGSPTEPKIDRLLSFADLVCQLYSRGIMKKHEMEFFKYRFLRMAENPGIVEYLTFLTGFYERVGIEKRPFHGFVTYSKGLGRAPTVAAQ